jgi:hypothetical protein
MFVLAVSAFSITMGIYVDTFKGAIDGCKVKGIYVNKVEPNYPAFGHIQIGDIITEAVLVGEGRVWNHCCELPQTGRTFVFNPAYSLNNQLFMLKEARARYYYNDINRWQDMAYLLNRALPGDTALLRLYRTQTREWLYVAVSLGAEGRYTFINTPQYQPVYVQPVPVVVPVVPVVACADCIIATSYSLSNCTGTVPVQPVPVVPVVPASPVYTIVIWLP